MKNKTCGDCRYYEHPAGQCSKVIEYNNCHITDKACEYFEPKQTNGDRIRQGGDDALIDFADGIRRKMCYFCAFFKDKSCVDKTGDCWAGIRAWLNAPADVCVKQNGNHDTQPGLCVADNTESEGEDE